MQGELPSQRITEGVIWKQLLFFFFPILLGSFFQQMYNTVDTIIVGRFVGTRAGGGGVYLRTAEPDERLFHRTEHRCDGAAVPVLRREK